ncbi:hypothetical protein F4808DRAFT_21175 [Astrocystis sublimbata]|nr:hypothetical protein F4808DRAFT_21175 [Astrocystis sublimbata]
MERKRKLPARAAARGEHVSKKRSSMTPDIATASTPSPTETSPQPADASAQEQPPSLSASAAFAALPKSLQPGHALPTVEKPQPDDLPIKDYQSVQESGVMAESLSKSRQKWVHDGVFEKYWTKPSKRKGVVKEDANNPAKDTMSKIGQVTIIVEPHMLEATMYAVKDPKPAPPPAPTFRPIIQYGPSNGTMPPPKTTTTPTATATSTPVHAKADEKPPARPSHTLSLPVSQPREGRQPEQAAGSDVSAAPGRDIKSVLAAPQSAQAPMSTPEQPRPSQPTLSQPHAPPTHPLHAPATASIPGTAVADPPPKAVTPASPKPASNGAPAADPIIVTLAERASEDPHLRDLMKRVAVGAAEPHELAHFQKIIDQITLDYKKKGLGPTADQIMVGNKSIKYFADNVKTILEIILSSNPNQRSYDLRSPPGTDPLVILLVKESLDKQDTKALVRRVAEGKTKFTDVPDLKHILEKMNTLVKEEAKVQQPDATSNPNPAAQNPPGPTKAEDDSKKPPAPAPASAVSQSMPSSQQALRSKGPPHSAKHDIVAVVLEFAGGTGDRYMFPKFSILEYSGDGTEVVASFLIVRRGSKLEYGGDRTMDYYQPVTLRLHSQNPKVLENLARVVAPEAEVQRYMDDVMETMTRAEYVLLAMRLPRADRDEPSEERPSTPKLSETSHPTQLAGPLWDSRPSSSKPPSAKPALAKIVHEDEQYQRFVAGVSQRPSE